MEEEWTTGSHSMSSTWRSSTKAKQERRSRATGKAAFRPRREAQRVSWRSSSPMIHYTSSYSRCKNLRLIRSLRSSLHSNEKLLNLASHNELIIYSVFMLHQIHSIRSPFSSSILPFPFSLSPLIFIFFVPTPYSDSLAAIEIPLKGVWGIE